MKKDKKTFDEYSGILYKSKCKQSSLRKQKRPNMNTYQIAHRYDQVKKQINALEKEKTELRKVLLSKAPQDWLDNPMHGFEREIDEDGLSLKFQWQKKSAYTVDEKFQKYITPTFYLSETEHRMLTRLEEADNTLALLIPPLPVSNE